MHPRNMERIKQITGKRGPSGQHAQRSEEDRNNNERKYKNIFYQEKNRE